MPLSPLAVPRYPSVPVAPGVPPLLRRLGAVQNKVVSVAAGVGLILNALRTSQWGLYASNGAPVVVAGSVVAVDLRKEFRVPDFPIEYGGFANYNKVELPFEGRLTFAQAGSEAERSALLKSVDRAINLLDLCTVVTPEFVYPDCNVTHYDYRRQAGAGATLLQVDVWVQQIRIVRAGRFTQTRDAASQDTQSQGTVAAQAPTVEQGAGSPPRPAPLRDGATAQEGAAYFKQSLAWHQSPAGKAV